MHLATRMTATKHIVAIAAAITPATTATLPRVWWGGMVATSDVDVGERVEFDDDVEGMRVEVIWMEEVVDDTVVVLFWVSERF